MSTEFRRALVIQDLDHFHAALEFSRENVKESHQTLQSRIFQLLTGNYGGASELRLFKDFVPHSFGFELRKGDQPGMNGGIICHGQGVETLSVELNSSPGVHYSIHT